MKRFSFAILLIASAPAAVRAADFQRPQIAVEVVIHAVPYAKCSVDLRNDVAGELTRNVKTAAESRFKFLRWRTGKDEKSGLRVTIVDRGSEVWARYSVGGEKDLERRIFTATEVTIRTADNADGKCDKPTILLDLRGRIASALHENNGANFVTDLLRDVPLAQPVQLSSSHSVLIPMYDDCMRAANGSRLELSWRGRPPNDGLLTWTLLPKDVWVGDDCYGCVEAAGTYKDSTREPDSGDWKRLRERNLSADYVFMTTYQMASGRRLGARQLPMKVKCEE